jgi:Mrp family chromosome partitioning ATPase
MKSFIQKSAVGEPATPQHFNKSILPDLEALYSAIKPGLDEKNQFIYIGASRKGEGASTIAWALAYYTAMREGQDCLFVDGDINSPTISMDSSMPDNGLTEYLHGSVDFKQLPFETELHKVSAIHSGQLRRNYVHLSKERTQDFLEQSKRYYRAVFFNATTGFSKYSELWGQHSDKVILVTKYRSTRREILSRVVQGFEQADISISGLVFNNMQYPIPEFIYRRL